MEAPHLPSSVKLWLGDPRGHWEGDTLVVDTTNYSAEAFMNASDELHVVERFFEWPDLWRMLSW